MEVRFLPQIFQNNYNVQNNKIKHNSTVMQSPFVGLAADTVSFSGGVSKVSKKVNKAAKTVMRDAMCETYEKQIPQYKIYANRLMSTLETIALKFKDRGVSFDRQYCEHAAVKSSESFVSKFLRSGEKPLDRIRSTLYVQDPHDFKLIDDILKEFESLGYEIANIPGTKKPDFDIRLSDVTATELEGLRSELRGCVGKPIPTGYEDIQLRLKDSTKKKAPVMEVLIIFGEKTAKAKIDESKYSYNIRRALKDLLHVNKVENPEVNSPAYRIKNNIRIIAETLSSAISRPLFNNAKNADYLHDSFRLPVELGEKTCGSLKGLLEGIRDKIPRHYIAEAKRIKSKDFDSEIENLFKSSITYKEREDKTIYVADIVKMRKELLAELRQYKADDMELIQKIQAAMDETIAKYGPKPTKPAKGKVKP